MWLFHSLRSFEQVLNRLQAVVVLVVIVIEILSVESIKHAKNSCNNAGSIVAVTDYDLEFKCSEDKQFSCGTPQRRAILLRTLLQLNHTTPTVPNMIIIYRCEDSGCCVKPHEYCTNTSSTKHKMNYTVIGGIQGETTIYNHTECACQFMSATQACFL